MNRLNTPQETNEIIQKRLRRVAEPLLSDEGLRDELTDTQAQQLLDWGLARLEETAVLTANLPDDDAMAVLEEKETAVRLIMRLVNDLVARPGIQPDEDLINTRLVRLGKNLQWLTGSPSDRERVRRIRSFRQQQDQLDRDTAFDLLYAVLNAPNEVE
jgi:hypothetical protein